MQRTGRAATYIIKVSVLFHALRFWLQSCKTTPKFGSSSPAALLKLPFPSKIMHTMNLRKVKQVHRRESAKVRLVQIKRQEGQINITSPCLTISSYLHARYQRISTALKPNNRIIRSFFPYQKISLRCSSWL